MLTKVLFERLKGRSWHRWEGNMSIKIDFMGIGREWTGLMWLRTWATGGLL
jgi:hypothetical protein